MRDRSSHAVQTLAGPATSTNFERRDGVGLRQICSGADEEDGDVGAMPDFVDGAAEEEVAEQTVAVCGHGNEVALFTDGGAQNFCGRVTQGEAGGYVQSLDAQLSCGGFQILAVGLHFFGFDKLEAVEVAGDPAIGNVHQEQLGMKLFGQFRDVREQAFIGLAIFEGD